MGANIVLLGLAKGLGTALALKSEADSEEKKTRKAAEAEKLEQLETNAKAYQTRNPNPLAIVSRNIRVDNPELFGGSTDSAKVMNYGNSPFRDEIDYLGEYYVPPVNTTDAEANKNAAITLFTGTRLDGKGKPVSRQGMPEMAEYYYAYRDLEQQGQETNNPTLLTRAANIRRAYNNQRSAVISLGAAFIGQMEAQPPTGFAGAGGVETTPNVYNLKLSTDFVDALARSGLPASEIQDIMMGMYRATDSQFDANKGHYFFSSDELTEIRAEQGYFNPNPEMDAEGNIVPGTGVKLIRAIEPVPGAVRQETINRASFVANTPFSTEINVGNRVALGNRMVNSFKQANISNVNVLGFNLATQAGAENFTNMIGSLINPQKDGEVSLFQIFGDAKSGYDINTIVGASSTFKFTDANGQQREIVVTEGDLKQAINDMVDITVTTGSGIDFVGRDLLAEVIAINIKRSAVNDGYVGPLNREQTATQSQSFNLKATATQKRGTNEDLEKRRGNVDNLYGVLNDLDTLITRVVLRDEGAPIVAAYTGLTSVISRGIAGVQSQIGQFQNRFGFDFSEPEDRQLYNYINKKYKTALEAGAIDENGAIKTDLEPNQQAALLDFLKVQAVYTMARMLENPQGGGARLSQTDIEQMENAFGAGGNLKDPREFEKVVKYALKKATMQKSYLDIRRTTGNRPFRDFANEYIEDAIGDSQFNFMKLNSEWVASKTGNYYAWAANRVFGDAVFVAPKQEEPAQTPQDDGLPPGMPKPKVD
ncbi:MAG TPA: hypothetical protein DCM40_22930 [Maribacter sp.]|nr:hypothetical protein [Maribacter sp.]